MKMLDWKKHKLEWGLSGEISIASDMQRHKMAENDDELKSLLMKAKEESEKVGLKLSIQKTKIMASGPITSWQIDGETVETVRDFILGGSKITVNGDCSHEIKRPLLLRRKVMTNLLVGHCILKSSDITLPTKICLVKAMVFLTLCNPMDCSLSGSSVHGFSRQEDLSGLPFPSLLDSSRFYNFILPHCS